MLIVNKMYTPEIGGIENVVEQIAKINADDKKRTTVIVFNKTKDKVVESNNNICVIRLGSIIAKNSIRWSFQYKRELIKQIKLHDTIVYNYPSFQPEFYKKGYGVKNKIVFYHADNTRYKFLGKLYQAIICKRFFTKCKHYNCFKSQYY